MRILIFLTLIFFSGCAPLVYTGEFELAYKSVRKENNGASTHPSFYSKDIGYDFTDSLISVGIELSKSGFLTKIRNNQAEKIKVLWDESVFVNITGEAVRVIHSGINYIEAEKSAVPSVIPENSYIEEFITPVKNIENVTLNNGSSYWIVTPFMDKCASNDKQVAGQCIQGKIGKQFGLLLAFEQGKSVFNYTFWFAYVSGKLKVGRKY